MRVACVSDLHGSLAGAERVGRAGAELLLVCGDITNFGGREEGERLLEGLRRVTGMRVLGVHGNCDRRGVLEALESLGASLHGRGVVVEGTGFFGVGGSSPTPFGTPSELGEEELLALLERGYRMVEGAETLVLVSHAPPRGAGDRTLSGVSAGSEAVRRFVEEAEPEFVVCGHIHEARGVYTLGRSRVLNTGTLRQGFGVLDTSGEVALL